jgi:hypothetical protein
MTAMGDRSALEAEFARLWRAELEIGKGQESIFQGRKKRPRPKGGPAGQMGMRSPSATGLYEVPEEDGK